jgi:glycosyltransferase involved in cell wall biosynthesis
MNDNVKKIKILHIGEYVNGGVATYIDTILGIDNSAFDEYLVMSKERSALEWDNVPADKIYCYDYRRGIFQAVAAMKTIYEVINRFTPDIIYCHSTWAGVMARVPLLFMRNRPKVIYNAHGWAFTMQVAGWKKWIYAMVERVLYHATDCVINVSNYEYNAARKFGIPADKMRVLYSGSNEVDGNNVPAKKLFCDSTINLLFVGRFDPQKGVDFLLKTFADYSRDDIHLYLIGDAVVSTNEYKKINDNRIHFLGWIPHGEMGAYYQSCDAVIMPSRWEAFGLVAIEAMKYKKTVIVSDRGALPELVKNGYNGYVFKMEDEGSLKSVFDKLEKKCLVQLGNNAFAEFKKNFSGSVMREKMKAIYEELLSGK